MTGNDRITNIVPSALEPFPCPKTGVLQQGGFKKNRARGGPASDQPKQCLVELLFFGGTRQRGYAGLATLDHGSDFVKVTRANFLLV